MSSSATRSRRSKPSARISSSPEPEEKSAPPPPPPSESLQAVLPQSPVPFISQSQLITLIFIAAIVAHGTLYASYHGTNTSPAPSVSSLQQGDLPPSSLPQSTSYFAQKGNVFNQVFAKKAWAWTTLAFFLHLLTTPSFISSYLPFLSSSPPKPPTTTKLSKTPSSSKSKPYLPLLPRLAKFTIATLFWILLTIWLAGPGLLERTMVYTGGECSIQLPVELCSIAGGAVECTSQSAIVISGHNALGGGAIGGNGKEVMLMTVPQEYCSRRMAVTPKSFPDLFPGWVEGEKHHRLHARWSGGHDVSGHVFLLTLSTLLLVDQTLPTILILLEGGVDDIPWAHKITGLFGFGLAGLWVFILSKTAMYFHTVPEKISGFTLAVVGLVFFQFAGASVPQK